ncbi:aldehyde dehydrogenase [Persicobacter psychrovividus]|uniref:Aldehyde dehydrogenase n=1 Tax=Persicobacter psychrovividus TaxID=387638 RepID=A0ABN6LFV0_9BACT|nr:aldehyde dehydrogenase [Persicobacter psychrovividus]
MLNQTMVGTDVKTYQNFLAGKLVSTAEHFEVLNPCTEEVIAMAPRATKQDAEMAVSLAKKAQVSWGLLPSVQRAEYLKKMAEIIREHRVFLAKTLATEQAKVLSLAQVEIDVTAVYFDYYAGLARSYEGEIIQSDRPNEQIMLHKLPIGIAVGICPWNFPFFVMARKIAPSLLTGNACIVKLSRETPVVCLEFASLIADIGLPEGILSILSGFGSEVGQALAEHPDVGIISLTGSVSAGQQVMEAASKNITKVSLELGGKAPAIVCKDADLDLAVKAIIDSRVIFSGQVCNCAERVYVEEEIYDAFMEKLIPAMKAVHVGDALTDENAEMSAQINESQLNKIEGMVNRAVEAGGKILVGGHRIKTFEKGFYFEPTLIVDVAQDSEIMQEETFGPILPVMKVSSFDQALDYSNDSEYGLTSSIFTNDINKILRATKELRYGETYVNREHFEAIQGFHAGFRKSGIGGADGKHGLEEYLQTKVMYIQQN